MVFEDFVISADIEGETMVYSMDRIVIDQFGGLQKLMPAMNEENPLAMVKEVANMLGNFSFDSLTVDTYRVVMENREFKLTEIINDYQLINLKNGNLELVSAGKTDIIAEIPGEGTVVASIGSMTGKNIDYGVIGYLFSETDGARDDTVRVMLEEFIMDDMQVILPEGLGTVSIGSIRMKDNWVRQLPISLTTIEAGIMDPMVFGEKQEMFESPAFIIDLVRSYGIGLIEMNDFAANIPSEGVDVSIDRIAYGGSAHGEDRLGEVAFQGISADIPGEGLSFKLEAAQIKGLDYGRLLDSAAKAQDLENFIPEALPSLELMQITGLDVKGPGGINISLANYELEIGESIGLMPTLIRLGMDNLKMPAALVDDRDAQELLAALGIENIDVSYSTRLDWDVDAKTISLSDSGISLADAGEVNLEASLGGIEEDMFMGPPDPEKMMGQVSLRSMAISYEDNSLFEKLVAFGAEQMGGTPDDLKGMMKLQSGMMLGQFGESEALTKLSNAIASFVDNPGRFAVSLNPDEPRLLAELMGLAMMNPAMIADVLKLDAVASSN